MSTQLKTIETGELATQQPSVAHMMQAFIDKGITPDNMTAFAQLVTLHERLEAKSAEREFTAAFVALQKELPVIVASTEIKNRGKYERYEDVMDVIQPFLTAHGFTVSFSQDFREDRIIETCRLSHESGHSRENSFAVRAGRADDATQADCKAATTAKRNALLNALNIVIRQDALQDEEGDARMEGSPITPAQADYLLKMVNDTRSDEVAFLKFAGARSYAEIAASKFARLDETLKKKLRK